MPGPVGGRPGPSPAGRALPRPVGHAQAGGSPAAHHLLCERVYGADLDQHGFADVAQLDALTDAPRLRPGDRALELGCGTGAAVERVARRTGARVRGLDLSATAVAVALARTEDRRDALDFAVADLNRLEPWTPGLTNGRLDAALGVDTLYFAADLPAVVAGLVALVRPGGGSGSCTATAGGRRRRTSTGRRSSPAAPIWGWRSPGWTCRSTAPA